MATQVREAPAGPNVISDALAQVTARLRLARWVRHASRGALGGVAVALVAVILAHLSLLPDWLPLEAVIPIATFLGVAAGTVTAFLRPIALMDAARLAEGRLGLKERLSSALEFERAPQATLAPDAVLLFRLQQQDAATHARSLKATEAVPLRLPWEAKAVIGSVFVLVLALVLPTLPLFISPGVQLERQIVHKTGDKLQKTARLIQKQAEEQHLEGTRRVAQNMRRLGQRMAQGRMDKKQAMVQMSKLTQQMKQEQQKMAQQNSGAGSGSKSLALAGQQLAQAMQSASPNSASAGSKVGGSGQKTGGSGSKNNQKNGLNGASGGKKGAGDKSSGFNIPGASKNKGSSSNHSPANTPATPEMQKAAQAMQQNDAQGLSEQLRQMANRTEAGQMSPNEQKRASQDLQNLANALKNTPMPETQKHTQAAADSMKRDDKQTAASEIRKAADAADREAKQEADQEAMQDAQQSVEDSESQMAGANSAGDIQDDSSQSGQGKKPGQGQGKGQGSGQGQGQGDGTGDGQGLPNSGGKHGSGKGNGGSGGGGKSGGAPRDTGEGSSPLKHLGKANPNNPKNGRLYFGKPENAGPSKTGPMRKVGSNPNATPGQTTSNVPYYNYVAPAAKSAESTMDKEDIPPAYRSDVRKYFNSLNSHRQEVGGIETK